jgi:uncharacterized protein (DUF2252 family)
MFKTTETFEEAIAATAPHNQTAEMPGDNAKRVVACAHHMSLFLGSRMLAGRLLDKKGAESRVITSLAAFDLSCSGRRICYS